MKKKQKPCPCGSLKSLSECCDLFLKQTAKPQTAEQLMRSRYTAYARGKISYIQNTMCEKAAEGFDFDRAKEAHRHTVWKGLRIIDAGAQKENIEEDFVTFEATYEEGGKRYVLHERSRFKKIAQQWFYVDGMIIH